MKVAMSPPAQNNTRGIWLMVLAMAAFAIADTIIKFVTRSMAVPHIVFLLMVGGLVIFIALAWINGEVLLNRLAFARVLLLRYAAEILGTFGMITALSKVDLTIVGAILQATPLVVAAGAVLFLGETVSWRRWSAIFVGFCGVLLIIRPGTAAFDVNVVWPLLAMFGLAARDLATRLTPPELGSATLSSYTMAAALPFAALWAMMSEGRLMPEELDHLMTFGMILFSALGYFFITLSVRMAEVSVVSPFRYSRLLFLLILGVIFFAERPDALTLSGAAIIVIAGIYTMWRDRLMRHGAS
ncbi:MAG: DMT family transporter [Pseudomonadota bacterium]